jgi:hypothetical protein
VVDSYTKKEIDTKLTNYINSEKLEEEVTNALEEAKASGAFKGDKGDTGATGATGPAGP